MMGTAAPASAQIAPVAPSPTDTASRHVRVHGSPALQRALQKLRSAFVNEHPGASLTIEIGGSGSSVASLYTGRADVVFMVREPTAKELMAYEWVYRRKPGRVEVATGGIAPTAAAPPLVALVHRDNPTTKISLAQLDAIVGFERRRGEAREISLWSQLASPGALASKRVTVYGPNLDSDQGGFLRTTIIRGSFKAQWDRFKELSQPWTDEQDEAAVSDRVQAAVLRDRAGIGLAAMGHLDPALKPLALSVDGASFHLPTRDALVTRQYPFARPIVALYHVDETSGTPPAPPMVAAFLSYVLGREGQALLSDDTGLLPLADEAAAVQLKPLTRRF